ncbi:MAG: DUF5615 family PIN-like protein [Verrucomicrobiia bacterium]
MRILLDECVPWPVQKLLVGHDCVTVQQRGWGGIKNGELLRLAEPEFDLFITTDQNIRYQQNLAGRRLPILELSTNNIRRLRAAGSLIQSGVAALKMGEFRKLDIP